ncbi:efflux RND transporter permease subunit [Natronorarus salvus]|uniref:efflux RND transporter permease subunit n=1 Tax=Natronorarus salvus TaxID=3117733 RepID=UPI002F25FEB6
MRSPEPIRRVNDLIDGRPGTVVVAFLLVTVVAFGGVGLVTQDAGADQFTEDIEAAEAQERMEEDFQSSPFAEGGGQLVVYFNEENALSREALLRQLETLDRLEGHDALRIDTATGPAIQVALALDPEAGGFDERYEAIEGATGPELREVIREAGVEGSVGTDFNPTAGSSRTAVTTASIDLPPQADSSDAATFEYRAVEVIEDVEGNAVNENVYVFGQGILETEILALLTDTAILVFPASILLILLFLAVAYRDPVDLVLGLSALVMTMVWTFGFMGVTGITFSDFIVPIIPLLLAVGIDFGIHVINRYREERLSGSGIGPAMRITTDQLMVAFFIVALTTVFSFLANLTSELGALRDFGIVASAGMVFTFLIFGIFLPAAKVKADRLRDGTRFPEFGTTPLGREGSRLSRVLSVGVVIGRVAPAVVLVVALVGAGAVGIYGTGVDTEFSEEAFFPDEDRVEAYQALPGPLAPTDYTFVETLRILTEELEEGFVPDVVVYAEGRMDESYTLAELDRMKERPPEAIATEDGRAEAESLVTVIDAAAEEDEAFAEVVRENDGSGDGIPDRNLEEVYDALAETDRGGEAENYLAEDRRSTRVIFTLEPDAGETEVTQGAQRIADRSHLDAAPTGDAVVNSAVSDLVFDSAIESLAIAFVLTALLLVASYAVLEGRPVFGLLNLVPVLVAVALLAGTMRYLGIPLTAFNAPIFTVAIGLGVDYTVHFMHRFTDEFNESADLQEALATTVWGTGGALTGSMLTTVLGIGVLYLAVIPFIGEFGVVIALGVLYAYLGSILVLPAAIGAWYALSQRLGLPFV